MQSQRWKLAAAFLFGTAFGIAAMAVTHSPKIDRWPDFAGSPPDEQQILARLMLSGSFSRDRAHDNAASLLANPELRGVTYLITSGPLWPGKPLDDNDRANLDDENNHANLLAASVFEQLDRFDPWIALAALRRLDDPSSARWSSRPGHTWFGGGAYAVGHTRPLGELARQYLIRVLGKDCGDDLADWKSAVLNKFLEWPPAPTAPSPSVSPPGHPQP